MMLPLARVAALRCALGIAATLTVVASSAYGQGVPDSVLTRRVRVHLARQDRSLEGPVPRQTLRGVVTRLTQDSITLVIHPQASPVTVATDGLYQIDVSRGINATRSAFLGGIRGAVTWAWVGSLGDEEFGDGAAENMLIWAGGGFVVGAVFGAIFPDERWRRVFRR